MSFPAGIAGSSGQLFTINKPLNKCVIPEAPVDFNLAASRAIPSVVYINSLRRELRILIGTCCLAVADHRPV